MQQKSQRREYHKGGPMNGQKNDLTKNACYQGISRRINGWIDGYFKKT